jgi:hypothetical protein
MYPMSMYQLISCDSWEKVLAIDHCHKVLGIVPPPLHLQVSSTASCTPIDFNPSKAAQLYPNSASVSKEETIFSPLHRYVTAMHATTTIRASPVPVSATTQHLLTADLSSINPSITSTLWRLHCYWCLQLRAITRIQGISIFRKQASRSDRAPSVTQIGCRGRCTQTCIVMRGQDRIRQKREILTW